MAIHKSKKGRQQLAFILGGCSANLGGDALGGPALEPQGATEFLVLPSGGVLTLAPNPHVGSAAAFPDLGLFGDESAIEARPGARNDLDDFHEFPPASLVCGQNIQRLRPIRPPRRILCAHIRAARTQRRSAAPFRRFCCRMGGRWDVALARFCCVSCMATILPSAPARAESATLSACRFDTVATAKIRAITDGRSFILEDGREIRLAGIDVPLPPAHGESGAKAEAGLAARPALGELIERRFLRLPEKKVGRDCHARPPPRAL